MKKYLGLGLVLILWGCSTQGLTPEQNLNAENSALRIEAEAKSVEAACARALPLANLAAYIPEVGTYVALGVRIGCGTANGIARLIQTPGTTLWLGQQEEILKRALKVR